MKVVKFGGSSMADAGQYRKIRDILLADPERKVVVVSAAGKRFSGDHKLTDLLYLCYSHVKYGVDPSLIFDMIMSRYLDIQEELNLSLDVKPELEELKRHVRFSVWEPVDENRTAVRFCTGWSTQYEAIDALIRDIEAL